MKGSAEMAALIAAVDGDADFELALGELVGRWRKKQEAAIRDREAADLLPLGWRVVVERLGGCKATAYNRAARGRTRSKSGTFG